MFVQPLIHTQKTAFRSMSEHHTPGRSAKWRDLRALCRAKNWQGFSTRSNTLGELKFFVQQKRDLEARAARKIQKWARWWLEGHTPTTVVNQEDPFTLEKPEKPVRVRKGRRVWVFEAKMLLQQLCLGDWRNPFTREPLLVWDVKRAQKVYFPPREEECEAEEEMTFFIGPETECLLERNTPLWELLPYAQRATREHQERLETIDVLRDLVWNAVEALLLFPRDVTCVLVLVHALRQLITFDPRAGRRACVQVVQRLSHLRGTPTMTSFYIYITPLLPPGTLANIIPTNFVLYL